MTTMKAKMEQYVRCGELVKQYIWQFRDHVRQRDADGAELVRLRLLEAVDLMLELGGRVNANSEPLTTLRARVEDFYSDTVRLLSRVGQIDRQEREPAYA